MRSTYRSSTPREPGGVSSASASSRAPTTASLRGARRCEGGAWVSSLQRSLRITSSTGCRRDQPARSRPGAGGRSSGQPRQSQPSVTTPSGTPTRPSRSACSNRVTQPTPSPSARAASQRFSMAHAHDHRSASGKVARPSTPPAGVRRSQATTTPRGASRIPSSWRSSNRRAASGSISAAWRSRCSSAIRAARSRVASSRDDDEPPGLAVPDGRGDVRGVEHPADDLRVDRVGAVPADVAPGSEDVVERLTLLVRERPGVHRGGALRGGGAVADQRHRAVPGHGARV